MKNVQLDEAAARAAEDRVSLARTNEANEVAILRRVLRVLEPLDWNAKLRVLDYVRSAAGGAPGQLAGTFNTGLANQWAPR